MIPFNHKSELQKLIRRYVSGTATTEEINFIEKYYQYLDKNADVLDEQSTDELAKMAKAGFAIVQANIIARQKTKTFHPYRYLSAAALLLLVSGITFVFLNKKDPNIKSNITTSQKLDILPGSNRAILTLADGSEVILDEHTSTNISNRDGVKISRTEKGQLVYTVLDQSDVKNNPVILFNTIQTPKGGQYEIILPDGTKVWLNAASSLKYPEVFAGNERKVELTGEAYFEVTKNKAKPFHVRSQHQDVEVLGTHFNINSYTDDNIVKTTLLEGSVRVSNGRSVKALEPGQQSVTASDGTGIVRLASNVDAGDETAWKNGLFQFNNSSLKSILNQLERWYDINIDYSSIPDKKYNGMVPRKAKLSEVLKMLEKTGNISFEIAAGRNLKVLTVKQ